VTTRLPVAEGFGDISAQEDALLTKQQMQQFVIRWYETVAKRCLKSLCRSSFV